ncbi:hypothetical protein GBA52_020859 [Prunus armeniaca]|nr:hypothetical protein GBA52_020859 [Prunus armeniaca]
MFKDGVLNSSNKAHLANDHGNDEESDSSELHEGVEESDSSEDEVVPQNTIGDVPLEWYQDEKHIVLLMNLQLNKIKLAIRKGHGESFNPSLEYIPTQEEINSYQLMYEEDHPKFIPKRGHEDAVTSVSVEASGQWIASGKTASSVSWLQDDKLEGIRLRHSKSKTVASVEWHRKKIIRVYDLVKEGKLVRKLEIGLREVSSIAVHPSDLNQNPLIVPLEILRGHSSTNGRGVMDCKFHPRQPWLFSAGADSVVRLFAIKRKRKETACTGSYCKLWISLVGSEFSVL